MARAYPGPPTQATHAHAPRASTTDNSDGVARSSASDSGEGGGCDGTSKVSYRDFVAYNLPSLWLNFQRRILMNAPGRVVVAVGRRKTRRGYFPWVRVGLSLSLSLRGARRAKRHFAKKSENATKERSRITRLKSSERLLRSATNIYTDVFDNRTVFPCPPI